VQKLAKALSQLHIEYFQDVKDINWGDRITAKLHGALREASHLVLVVSPGSVKSQWVAFEVGYALGLNGLNGLNVTILPFLTHPSVDVPGFLRGIRHVGTMAAVKEFFAKEIAYDKSVLASAVDQSR
jgi:hypothetical protein